MCEKRSSYVKPAKNICNDLQSVSSIFEDNRNHRLNVEVVDSRTVLMMFFFVLVSAFSAYNHYVFD